MVFCILFKKSSKIVSCLKESFRFKINLCFKIGVVNINGFGVNLVLCGCFFYEVLKMSLSRRKDLNYFIPSFVIALLAKKTYASNNLKENVKSEVSQEEKYSGMQVSKDVDNFLHNKLSSLDGSKMLGYKNTRFRGTYLLQLSSIESNNISLLEFIPPELHNSIREFTCYDDLTQYIQKAIDAIFAIGGGVITCPPGQYYMNIKTKPGVILMGARMNSVRRTLPWSFETKVTPFSTRFRNFSKNDWVISSETELQDDKSSKCFGLIGIDFDAKDANNSAGGVRLRGPEFCIKSCSFFGFQDQGLEVSGNIGLIEDVIANACLKNKKRTQYVGTIEVSGASDCHIHRVEGNAQVIGMNSISSSQPYICGIKIVGNNHYVSGLMGEMSETGIYIGSSSVVHKVTNCRADNNAGPGYIIHGVMGNNLHSYNNSRTGDGLYSGFQILDRTSTLFLSNCLSETDRFPVDGTGEQRKHKYGYDVALMDFPSLHFKPWLNQCFSRGHKEGWINSPKKNGVQYTPTIGILNLNKNIKKPMVDGVSVICVGDDGPSEIIGFNGGMIGQRVDLFLLEDKVTTLVSDSTFKLNNSDVKVVPGRVYSFIKISNDTWLESSSLVTVNNERMNERPRSNTTAGMMYFDSDLNKPIWRNANNDGWVDAVGNNVD